VRREDLKIGDEVEVIRLVERNYGNFYSIGARGIVVFIEDVKCLIKFTSGKFNPECNSTWWVGYDEIELVENIKPTLKRGFDFISLQEWNKSIPQDVDFEQWALLYQDIKLPKRATRRSAGYDVFSPFTFTLEPNEVILIPTGIKAYMLDDEVMYGYPRSSKGFKFAMRLMNTICIGDSDYYNNENNEGHYFIKIRNEGDKSMTIEKGEGFAQFIFSKYLLADGDSFDEGNDRIGGIGSTD
jgi:dUTP pyrophosphatase